MDRQEKTKLDESGRGAYDSVSPVQIRVDGESFKLSWQVAVAMIASRATLTFGNDDIPNTGQI